MGPSMLLADSLYTWFLLSYTPHNTCVSCISTSLQVSNYCKAPIQVHNRVLFEI